MFAIKFKLIFSVIIISAFSLLLLQRNNAREALIEQQQINYDLSSDLNLLKDDLEQERLAISNLNQMVKNKDLELISITKKTKELLQNETCNSIIIPNSIYLQLQQQYKN